jgi:hypothetical protein
MNIFNGKITGIFFLFISTAAYGQNDSTVIKVPTILRYTLAESEIDGSLKFYSLDTALDDIQNLHPAIQYFYNDLGNTGSAADPKQFSMPSSILTRSGNTSYELYQYFPEKVRYYRTNKRFSQLRYHLSSGKEQQITLNMDQNIYSNWNLGFDFNRLGSIGFMNNSHTRTTNFNLFTWFRTPNSRYQAFASATWNSIKNEVSGGLKSDSLYENNQYSNNDLAGLGVGLIDAEHQLRNHVFALNHFYDLLQRKDTTEKTFPLLRLQHISEYERYTWNYDDNNSDDSAYYTHDNFPPDIKDSLHYNQWVNRISMETFLLFPHFRPIHHASFKVTGGYQWFEFVQVDDTTLNNYFAEANVRTAGINNRTTLDITGRYVIDGANENDHFFRLKFGFPLILGATMHIGLQNTAQSPALFHNLYISDHYAWMNDFDKTTSQQFFIGIDWLKYKFSVAGNSTSIGRYIYYNVDAKPAQSRDSIRVDQLFIRKDFSFWRIRFNNSIWMQETDNDVIRIPEFNTHHTLFYEDRFFKGKLASQIGFDVHYSSEYFSNAYTPSTSVFYQQNENETNGYALIDFFINFKIKSARLTFKFHNIGDNLVAFNYENTPHYPMPGTMFQFGVTWRFFDE